MLFKKESCMDKNTLKKKIETAIGDYEAYQATQITQRLNEMV